MSTQDLYTIPEAMKLLGGISRNTIYALLREGKLASVPIGRRRFIPARAIEDFVATTMTNVSPSLAAARSRRAAQMPLQLGAPRQPRHPVMRRSGRP
jgi:excisionase family DNA binding protein